MGSKMPSVKLNAFLNVIRAVMSILFPLITYPYVTRLFQADVLGKVNFSGSTISYFSLLAGLGLTSYAAREGVKYRDDSIQLSQFSSELLTLNFCTTILAYVMLIVITASVPKFYPYIGLLVIYSITILFSPLGVEWLYTLHEDYSYITLCSIAFQIISLILLFLLVREKEDYYIYVGINVLASVGGNIFNFIHAKKYISFKLTFNKKIFRHLKYSLVFFSNQIASSIYSNIDTTMLGLMCSDYNVGIYAVSVKIYSMIKSVLAAIMAVMVSRLTYYHVHDLLDEFNDMVTKLIKFMITLLLPVVVGINLTANEIILVISGEGYIESEISLRILSFAILGSIFASITSQILLACRKEKIVLRGTVSAAVVNLATNLVMIPLFSQNGAAVTTVIAEFVVLGVGYWNSRKLVKIGNVYRIIVSSTVGCIIMTLIAIVLHVFINNVFVLLVCKVIFCAGVYFIILILLKNEIAVELMRTIKVRIKKFL